jgi:phosphoglycerate dehydrogenase-like enzyme
MSVLACVPLSRAGIIDTELLSWLPQGAALVNAARGQHVDEQALLAALDAGEAGETTTAAGGGVFVHGPFAQVHSFPV